MFRGALLLTILKCSSGTADDFGFFSFEWGPQMILVCPLRCGYRWPFGPMPMGPETRPNLARLEHDPGPIIIGLRAARAR